MKKKDWDLKKLGEVSKINYGYTEKASFEEIGPKFLRITDIQDNNVAWDTVPFCKIEKKELSKYKLSEGDIVFARTGATTGKSFLVKNPPLAVFASYLIRLQVLDPEKLLPDFLCLYFQTEIYWNNIKSGLSGSAQGGFNASKLADILIPIPSIHEQKYIVDILNKAFNAIESAKENAQKNLKNAREIFESYLQNVFAHPSLGWEVKKLKEIGCTQTGTTPKTSNPENYGDFIPFVKPADIDILGTGEIRFNNEGLSKEGLDNARKISKNSILMVCIGDSIGKVGYTDRDVSCNQQINTLTVKQTLDYKFFYYALRSQTFIKQVIEKSSQATLPIINKSKWENLLVSFPKSISEQQHIVAKLDSISIETKKLEAIYNQKLNNIEELKKSILQKAFNGEL